MSSPQDEDSQGKFVNLIEFVRSRDGADESINLNTTAFNLLDGKIINRPVCLLGVTGVNCTQKRVLLAYVIRCLKGLENEKVDWMEWENPHKKLEYFLKPEANFDRESIFIWNQAFIVNTEDNKELAVLLLNITMCNQDGLTGKYETLLNLAMLASSIMVFNCMENIDEKLLSSTLASIENRNSGSCQSTSIPACKKAFLVQNWNDPAEYVYGKVGGGIYFRDKLKKLSGCNTNVGLNTSHFTVSNSVCFLMPTIGDQAENPTFSACISEMAHYFCKRLEEFISSLINSDTLFVHKHFGQVVTSIGLQENLFKYEELFNSCKSPTPKQILQANRKAFYCCALKNAEQRFQKICMRKLRGKNYVLENDLKHIFDTATKETLQFLEESTKGFGFETEPDHIQNLQEKLIEKMADFSSQNSEKRKKYIDGLVNEALLGFQECMGKAFPWNEKEEQFLVVGVDPTEAKPICQKMKTKAMVGLKSKLENEAETPESVSRSIGVLETQLDTMIDAQLDTMIGAQLDTMICAQLDTMIGAQLETNSQMYANYNIWNIYKKLIDEMEGKICDFIRDTQLPGSKKLVERVRLHLLQTVDDRCKLSKDILDFLYADKTVKHPQNNAHETPGSAYKSQQTLAKSLDEITLMCERFDSLFSANFDYDATKLKTKHKKVLEEITIMFSSKLNPYEKGCIRYNEENQKLKDACQILFANHAQLLERLQTRCNKQYDKAAKKMIAWYVKEVSSVINENQYMSEDELEELSENIGQQALQTLNQFDQVGKTSKLNQHKDELKNKVNDQYKKFRKNNADKRNKADNSAKLHLKKSGEKYQDLMKIGMKNVGTQAELRELHEASTEEAKELFRRTCPQKLMTKYYDDLVKDIEEVFDELKDVFDVKKAQADMAMKGILFSCQNLYKEEMVKHLKNLSFIPPKRLDMFHAQAADVSLRQYVEQSPLKLTDMQKRKIREDLEIALLKYKSDNLMKLNFAPGQMPAIGIDLGTTYCCVAVYYNGNVIIIPNYQQGNSETTPSYVAYNEDGSKTIGEAAKRNAYENAASTIFDAKRIIGRKFDDSDLQKDMNYWPFKVVEHDGVPKIEVRKNLLFPQQVSAELLFHLKEMTEKHLQLKPGSIQKAVITVPAYFNDGQRQATKEAGAIAGLEVLTILNEPTAAAIAYSLERLDTKAKKVLVFDLGGGTFDVAILDVSPTEVKALGVDGDTHLGGEDFDQILMTFCADQFKDKTGIDILAGKNSAVAQEREKATRGLKRLQIHCEQSKIALSAGRVTTITVDAMSNGVDLSVSVTSEKFEELCKPLFERTIQILERALQKTAVRKEQIQDIVLIGGSTRIPMVQEMLSKFFNGKALNYSIHPDKAVAYGAAVKAALMNGEQTCGEIKLDAILDVTPMSLGVEASTGEFSIILPKNTQIPKKLQQWYVTDSDNQTTVLIRVYQGENPVARRNDLLGEFLMSGIPANKAGKEVVEVSMEVDAMGILHVVATSTSTSGSRKVVIDDKRNTLDDDLIAMLLAQGR